MNATSGIYFSIFGVHCPGVCNTPPPSPEKLSDTVDVVVLNVHPVDLSEINLRVYNCSVSCNMKKQTDTIFSVLVWTDFQKWQF